MPRRWIVLSILVVAACRPAPTTTPVAPDSAAPPAPDEPAADDDAGSRYPTANGEKPNCGEGGHIWDGHHDNCRYEHAGCCYDNPAAACSAASCSDETCRIMEVAPAQILCEPPASSPKQS